jgi:three-Cys-motif partner protein
MPALLDDWTSRKLVLLQRYLSAFTTAANAGGFSAAYIDAFTGADYRGSDYRGVSRPAGFSALAEAAPKTLLKQGVRTALASEPAFDGYIFIGHDRRRRYVLEAYAHEFGRNIQIRRSDANRELARICRLDWHMRRGVLFVDAYAANLQWDTLTTIARTQTIDVWLLLPVGFGPARLPSDRVPATWRDRVSNLLRREDWCSTDLEGPTFHLDRCVADLNESLESSMRSTFARVAPPKVLRSHLGTPLYTACFGSSAPESEACAAVELANQLLEAIGS